MDRSWQGLQPYAHWLETLPQQQERVTPPFNQLLTTLC